MTDEAIKALATDYLAHKDTIAPNIRGWDNIIALVRVCLAAEKAADRTAMRFPQHAED